MDLMEIRRSLLMIAIGGVRDLTLEKTYTVTESWESDAKGNPGAIMNTIYETGERQRLYNENDYLVLVVKNNTASNYKALWAVYTARDTSYGACVRSNNGTIQYRAVGQTTSFWISSGATIEIYKGTVANLL